MKLSIEFDPSSSEDIAQLERLAASFGGNWPASAPVVTTPRTTRRSAKETTLAALELIAAQDAQQKALADYQQAEQALAEPTLLEQAIAETVVKPTIEEIEEEIREAREPEVDAPTLATTEGRTRDELMKAARQRSQEEGALWMRGIIQTYSIKSLTELTDAQLVEILA